MYTEKPASTYGYIESTLPSYIYKYPTVCSRKKEKTVITRQASHIVYKPSTFRTSQGVKCLGEVLYMIFYKH